MTRAKRFVLGGSLLAAVAVGAAWLLSSGCQIDRQVTEPYREPTLTGAEILTMLASGDFKQTLEASKQIDRLASEEKLAVLLDLARDQNAATRLLAVKKLADVDDPRARKALADMAKDDPDPTVRELAAAGS